MRLSWCVESITFHREDGTQSTLGNSSRIEQEFVLHLQSGEQIVRVNGGIGCGFVACWLEFTTSWRPAGIYVTRYSVSRVTSYGSRFTFYVPRVTLYVLRFPLYGLSVAFCLGAVRVIFSSFHVLRCTLEVLCITFHALHFTCYVGLWTFHV